MDSIFACGFEEGIFGPHWTTTSPAISITTSSPISGVRSLRANPSANSNTHAVSVQSFGAGLIIVRFRVRFATLPDNPCALLTLPASTTGVWVTIGALATIGAVCNGSQGNGVQVQTGIVANVDCRIDTRANPWTVDVQVNGTPAQQATAAVAASTSAQQLHAGLTTATAMSGDVLLDDFVISVTEADYPIGPGYVHPFVPTSDGTHNIAGAADFQRGNTGTDILNATTTAFQLIDDVPLPSGTVDEADNIRAVAPPNATDYVECVFGPAPGISAPTVAPRAVEVVLAHHQIATQTGQSIVELNDNGTIDTVFDTGASAGVVTYRYARKHYATGPAGAWVIGGGGNGDFTDLRCRFRAPDAAPDQCLDAIMIEAAFRGPLFTKQALQVGDVLELADAHADVPAATSYDLAMDITETADTVVTTVVSASNAEGETPQQQAVLESRGGGDVGITTVNPRNRVHARVSVATAGTDVGASGSAS